MSAVAPVRLDLRPPHLALLRQLLRQHLPQAEVWAYGSRVNGDGHDASDLDLAVRQPANLIQATPHLEDLREALMESDLPIRVDVTDWARMPASFQREIAGHYVVVQGQS